MKNFNGFLPLGILAVCLTAVTARATQQAPVNLGSNSTFAILAGTSVTVTGGGGITGNIGISPGTTFVAGTPAVTVNGMVHAGDTVAAQAQVDLSTAYNDAAGRQTPVAVSGNIGGQILTPGLYKSTSSLAISSGDLTLDAQGDANAVFIFQIGSTLTLTSGRQVLLAGNANAANIYWQVGSSATLGTTSVLHGNILAAISISILTGATLDGRALAQSGGVTIDTGGNNNVAVPPAMRFIPVTPCRVADTRNPAAPFGGPFLVGQNARSFTIPNSSCGIPNTAQAYSFNVGAVPHGVLGYLTMWPTGQTQPNVSTLNSDGRTKSTAAIISAGTGGAVSVFVTQDADLVLDINGYFVPVNTPGELAYYPVTSCRLTDTRNANGPFGGPFLAGQTSRTMPMVLNACNVPSNAAAYSINLTAVPRGPLGYLTAWPTGSTQPYVASLNDVSGTVASNAAIVPAGANGSIDIFASNDTDLVIDINGYFAVPGTGGLSLYTAVSQTPCRVYDSRPPSGSLPFSGARDISIITGSCGVPASAQAYIFNATVVPQGALGYLTLWAQGAAQPLVSSLNAVDGAVTSNMAIVETSNGSISAFASNSTHLVLDIFGYFAP